MSGSSATSVGPGGADRRPHSRVSYGNCSNYSSFRVFGCFWMLLSVSLTVLLLQDLPTSVGVRFQAPLDVSELPKPHFSSPESFGSVAAAACFSNSVYSQCFKSFTSTPQMSMPQYNISGRFATPETLSVFMKGSTLCSAWVHNWFETITEFYMFTSMHRNRPTKRKIL